MDPSVFVHDLALCECEDVGPRTRIWAFAHVMKGARVGADCNLGDHVFIESGARVGERVTVKNGVQIWDKVVIEDDVFVGPGAVFTNDLNPRAAFKKAPERFLPTLVCRGATIGANSTIVCGVKVGAQAFVGAGAVVSRDVLAHALVVGNPARRLGWVCRCGERLAESLCCPCGCAHELVSASVGLRQTT